MCKVCTKCNEPNKDYYKDNKTNDGLKYWCKECMRRYSKNRRTKTLIEIELLAKKEAEERRNKYKIDNRTANKYLRIANQISKKINWQEQPYYLLDIKFCEW